ncbi:MAG TPA: DNA mismatch repair endonuclease MutH [Polyangiaceae bacterium]
MPEPLRSEAELVARASQLAGVTLGELARGFGLEAPADLRGNKGFVGQLVERALGAVRGSRPGPDFHELGVELKTLPVDARGRPVESTFVCTIPLRDVGDLEWEESPVRAKLRRVLFVPVEGERERPVAARRVGAALLWSPSAEEESDLRFDWEELAGRIGRGEVESITGHLGQWLQVRPKAADSQARRRAFDADGVAFPMNPRGFYLRARFTERIIRENYALGG